jgi:APA family basic amino acid/polyamine antiporter
LTESIPNKNSSSSPTFIRQATGLVKQLSPLDSLGIALSSMGLLFAFNVIVFLPAFYPGANLLATPFLGLLFMLPVAGVYILLSVAMPRAGGDYVWVSRIANPAVGFVNNFALTVISLAVIGIGTPTISSWAIAEMFYDFGKIYNNQNFLNIATSLQNSTTIFEVSAVLVLIAGIAVIFSSRFTGRMLRYWTFIALFIGVVFVATVLIAGQSTFISNFNSLSGSNYTGVVQAGQNVGAYPGVPPVFTWATVFASAASGALGFLGFYNPVYVASEVKQARRSMVFSQLGALVIFAIFAFVISAVEYFGEGPAFANSIAALWNAGSPQFPYVAAPLASGMSMFWTQNPILIAMFSLGYAATIFFFNIATLFAFSRNLFAWSFDRVTPSLFADVNERTRTPINATIVMMIAAMIYVYISVFQFGILASYFSFSTAGTFIATIVVAIVAIIYPFRRKDIFESSDALSRKKVGGMPLISLFGFLTLISSVVIIYAVIYPILTSNFLTILVEGILPPFIIGAIVYAIALTVRRSRGIDLVLIQREIPPE